MTNATAVDFAGVSHRYGDRQALFHFSLSVGQGEVLALLGPNGSGKTTLFRLLSTLMPLAEGDILVEGHSVRTAAAEVRSRLGIVFQSPSVDKHLTVAENLAHQGSLYGLSGAELKTRIDELLQQVGLSERRREYVKNLSGGQRRRVELAKGLLHQPRVLVLDEPSTGLDPGARSDMWTYLFQLRQQRPLTIVVTTHLLEEAERASRIAIMHAGKLVALDTSHALRASLGGETLTIAARDPEQLITEIGPQAGVVPLLVDGTIRMEVAGGYASVAPLLERFRDRIDSLTIGKPTLEDVYIARTGHRLFDGNSSA